MIHQPTKEHTALAVQQNEGGARCLWLFIIRFDKKFATLSVAEKDTLKAHIAITVQAIKKYTDGLKQISC